MTPWLYQLRARAGTVLYASTDEQESLIEAREWIKEQGLTSEHVRLIRVDGQIRVVVKEGNE